MSNQARKLQPKLFHVFGSKSVLLAMCLLAACTFLLFYIDYQREKERALESVQGKFTERLTALDRAVDSAEASVDLMRKWAESYLTTVVEQTRPSPLFSQKEATVLLRKAVDEGPQLFERMSLTILIIRKI